MHKYIGMLILMLLIIFILVMARLSMLNPALNPVSEREASETPMPQTNVGRSPASSLSTGPSVAPGESLKEESTLRQPADGVLKIVYIGSASPNYGWGESYSRITLYARLREGETVDITGWKLKSSRGEIIIPQAIEIYEPSGLNPPADIVLKQNNYLELYSSVSPLGRNFRLNKCIGYLNETYRFNPSLPQNCPYIDRSEIRYLPNYCQNYIFSLGSCRTPDVNSLNILPGTDEGNLCRNFLQNINYNGCFNRYRWDKDFFENEWRIWLNYDILDSNHDYLRLYDKQGNLISEYTY